MTAIITMRPAPYLAFTADTTEEQARAAFVKRFGVQPEQVGCLFPGRELFAGPQPANTILDNCQAT